jgi:glycosyltransferase involved in cell wall biosynthesis
LYCQRFICVSSDIASTVVHRRIVPARKVVMIPNGIETSRFDAAAGSAAVTAALRQALGIPLTASVIGTVGNLREVKRQDVLVRALGEMQANAPAADRPHLLLVGDGPLRSELQQLTDELGLTDRVHFAGAQTEPERFLQIMDVFALTSRSEGMPLAVLEAWAAELPVVASRVGGIPELIQDGKTGLLFESGDTRGLSEALEGLLANPACAARLARHGFEQVRAHFDVSVMASAYRAAYQTLLDPVSRRHRTDLTTSVAS